MATPNIAIGEFPCFICNKTCSFVSNGTANFNCTCDDMAWVDECLQQVEQSAPLPQTPVLTRGQRVPSPQKFDSPPSSPSFSHTGSFIGTMSTPVLEHITPQQQLQQSFRGRTVSGIIGKAVSRTPTPQQYFENILRGGKVSGNMGTAVQSPTPQQFVNYGPSPQPPFYASPDISGTATAIDTELGDFASFYPAGSARPAAVEAQPLLNSHFRKPPQVKTFCTADGQPVHKTPTPQKVRSAPLPQSASYNLSGMQINTASRNFGSGHLGRDAQLAALMSQQARDAQFHAVQAKMSSGHLGRDAQLAALKSQQVRDAQVNAAQAQMIHNARNISAKKLGAKRMICRDCKDDRPVRNDRNDGFYCTSCFDKRHHRGEYMITIRQRLENERKIGLGITSSPSRITKSLPRLQPHRRGPSLPHTRTTGPKPDVAASSPQMSEMQQAPPQHFSIDLARAPQQHVSVVSAQALPRHVPQAVAHTAQQDVLQVAVQTPPQFVSRSLAPNPPDSATNEEVETPPILKEGAEIVQYQMSPHSLIRISPGAASFIADEQNRAPEIYPTPPPYMGVTGKQLRIKVVSDGGQCQTSPFDEGALLQALEEEIAEMDRAREELGFGKASIEESEEERLRRALGGF